MCLFLYIPPFQSIHKLIYTNSSLSPNCSSTTMPSSE